MKGILLTLVFGYTLLSTIGGPINSDPAPGRSPGPPPQKFSLKTSSSSDILLNPDPNLILNINNYNNVNDSVNYININNSNDSDNSTNININNKNVFIQNSNNSSNNVHLTNSMNTLSSSNVPSSYTVLSRNISNINNNNNNNNTSNKNSVNTKNKNSNINNNNEFLKLKAKPSNTFSTNGVMKICRQKFINESGKIVKLDYSNEDIRWSFPLKMKIIHDLFHVDDGVFPGLVYTVELSQTTHRIRIQDFYVETYTKVDEPRGQFFTKFLNSKNTNTRRPPPSTSLETSFTKKTSSSLSYNSSPSSALTSSEKSQNKYFKNFWSSESFDDTDMIRPPPPPILSLPSQTYTTLNRKSQSSSSSSTGAWGLLANEPNNSGGGGGGGGGSVGGQKKTYKDINYKWQQHEWNIENETNDDDNNSDDDIDEDDNGGNNSNNNNNNDNNGNDPDDSGNSDTKMCFQNIWHGKWLYENKKLTANWTLNNFNYNDNSDNIYFRILYRTMKNSNIVFEIIFPFRILQDCNLYLKNSIGYLDNTKLPVHPANCTVYFPSDYSNNNNNNDNSNKNISNKNIVSEPYGLLIQLNRLNIPCQDGGYIKFNNLTKTICGKLEELRLSDRVYYFTSNSISLPQSQFSINLFKSPLFNLNYKLVDYCYNITYNTNNRTVLIKPRKKFECYFKIHLPYGNKILLNLITNSPNSTTSNPNLLAANEFVNINTLIKQQAFSNNFMENQNMQLQQHVQYQTKNYNLAKTKCAGLFIELLELTAPMIPIWYYCLDTVRTKKQFTFISNDNIIVIRVTKPLPPTSNISLMSSSDSFLSNLNNNSDSIISNNVDVPSILINYVAQSNETIVSQCAFGWIAYRQFCISAIEKLLTWHEAETECVQYGGHLPSIRTEMEQNIIDQLLMNSPGYSDHNAYWIGASDKNLEGDFRWSDGIQFTYSNWFTGWAQHGHYNRQPNDDGLSSQDCVEIRRHFSVPPGGPPTPTPLSSTYKWNDRDCTATNYFICERPMTDVDDLDEKGRVYDCNTTIVLTRENPRVSVSSPGFPRQYQALQSCYTIITAPEGYRLILDFEELVLEAEPKCDYDYLEIFDIPKLNLQNDKLSSSMSSTSSSSSSSFYFNSTNNNQQAQIIEFLVNKKIRPKYILPDLSLYKNSEHNKQKYKKKLQNLGRGPRKVCGDWSSTLKLLRYVTQTPSIGLHFKSDYSNHLGGYKAKVSMENVASECSDERLKPYNGSCYYFVSYPKLTWKLAQQICHSIGSQLASISSSNEQRFVTTNIRNHVDYTPRALYWLGGELAENHEYEWTDGSKMSFKGWLPGQEIVDDTTVNAVKDPMCLSLQWKTSPTPMLPSGLYWSSQKCATAGGYVCKGQKHGPTDIFIQNQTITGIEGRLTSPGYPNIYPSNLDYWIHIIGPDRTRIVVQFQKIDLELQDDCLYDYVSIRDYDPMLDTNPQFDPGLNSIPIAMLKNDHFYIDYQNDGDEREDDFEIDNEYDRDQKDNFDITKDLIDKNLQLLKDGNGDDDDDILDKDIKKSFKKLEKTLRHRFGAFKKVRRRRFLTSDQISNEIGDSVNNINSDSSNSNSGTPKFLKNLQLCGTFETDMSQFDYISQNNQAILHFHSDFSIAGTGFSATWLAVDVSGCPLQTLTSREGYLNSPNYPHFLLNNLDCTFLIQAPVGKKVWLDINDYDLRDGYDLTIDLGDGEFKPFSVHQQLNDGVFVSQREKLKIRLRTGNMPKGRGFRMFYKTMHPVVESRALNFLNTTQGSILHLNYPKSVAADVEFTQHLFAPMGDNILVELNGVELSEAACHDGNGIEIYDNYADNNGTIWNFCEISSNHSIVVQTYQTAPIYITSYLNSLHIRQKTSVEFHLKLNATVKVQPDVNFKLKLVKGDDWVETCQPNPCLFGGKCVSSGDKRACQCRGHYVGRFCGLTMCETDPCLFGKCELTASSFKCHCQPGYVGKTCDTRQKPCAESPCEGRGECFDKNGGYFCRCYAWWEGPRCEKRMINIPYKPLSERMLQEPFWLGLITVFIVLAIIGLVWCAKRHFPEKIEKLLSEEADRTRPFHSHHPSLREQLQFTSAIQQNAATTPASARTIFGRLGIRKPSILSLSSPHPPATGGAATARTFSLDDLLRPPPRRTPSPRKKRNNSTPTKKNAAEKKQILQQLIAPAINQTRPKVTLGELVHLSEQNRLRGTAAESENDVKETTFSENSGSVSTATVSRPISDPKFEKKVTFARLLNKVSAEISSGSELDIGNGNHNSSALSLPVEIPIRANSVPPSPSTNDMRSPHSTSSNQGSDSLSSSDLYLNLRNSRRLRPKVSSADSILAMFKNFASTTVSPSSKAVSPSTTPTASSPQDEVMDDDSSTSSIHTPASFSSGPPDSPVFYRQSTIEVPVLDPLSAHKSNTCSNLLQPPTILLEIPRDNNSLKCLSPIREMPTPMPSPALTPIMHRPNRLRQQNNISMDNPLPHNYTDDTDEFVVVEDNEHNKKHKPPMLDFTKCNFRRDSDATPTDTISTDDSNASSTNPQRKTRLQIQTPAISISIDIDPPTPTECVPSISRELVIPALIVEQPSPTKARPQFLMFPGSPPPQRASIGETSFMFPNKQQQKRLLKQFDKPTSLDLPFAPPMITITSNMSEIESDAESVSPAQTNKHSNPNKLGLMPNNSVGMCYLSPFSICTRGDRTTSESNLSSSGYSSMASPGPSRCGSSNPLCPSETEDPGTGHGLNYHTILPIRRPNPILKPCQENTENGGNSTNNGSNGQDHGEKVRRKSDSETLSDDPLLESNDEGIGTDHIDEKIDEGEIKSAKELELYIGKELIDNGRNLLNSIEETCTVMSQLKLPSIVIQTEPGEKGVSPVSSRSESPLSERTGMGRFSPLFYGRKDSQLPFTDSDGLYDFPSSDGKGNTVTHQRKSSKRRERKSSRAGLQHSPTKSSVHLEIPGKENPNNHHNTIYHHQNPKHYHHASLSTTRKSPKRRPIQRHPVASSSSSSENLTSVREVIHRTKAYPSTSTKQDYVNQPIEQKSPKVLSRDVSEEDTEEDVSSQILPKTTGTDVTRPQRKINRLRAIGHQIRFLRRLEQSIKQKERHQATSPPDSSPEDCNDGSESPCVTSPLLQPTADGTAKLVTRPNLKITRQKRLLCHPSTDKIWREREKGLLHQHGDATSD